MNEELLYLFLLCLSTAVANSTTGVASPGYAFQESGNNTALWSSVDAILNEDYIETYGIYFFDFAVDINIIKVQLLNPQNSSAYLIGTMWYICCKYIYSEYSGI
jgi:hypothetical protein